MINQNFHRLFIILLAVMTIFAFLIACDEKDDEDDDLGSGDDDSSYADDDDAIDDDDNDNDAPYPGHTALPWISAKEGRMVDEYGRQWNLRGINARIEGLFDVTFDDGRTALEEIPDFDEEDAVQMVAAGYNFLRLPINWSGLEPKEGQFNQQYLARLDEVVQLASDAGLYVLIDFHQDAFSKEIGEDGAPLWAIIPEPAELLEGPLDDLDERRMSLPVLLAFRSFFKNKENIQDRFLPAWKLIVERFADAPHVIGFEPMNEPVSYYVGCFTDCFYQFYHKVIAAMRELDPDHTIWLEPDTSRNQLLWSPLVNEPFMDTNIIYEPHLYPYKMGYDTYDGWTGALEFTFDLIVKEAASWGAVPVIGEWGTNPLSDDSPEYIDAVYDMAMERNIGTTFWLWKEISQGYWGYFDFFEETEQWSMRDSAGIETLYRPFAMAVPGVLTYQYFNRDTQALTVEFDAEKNLAPPLIYIPQRRYLNGFTVTLNGQPATVDYNEETQRAIIPYDHQSGPYTLIVK